MLFSVKPQHESAAGVHISPLSWTSLPCVGLLKWGLFICLFILLILTECLLCADTLLFTSYAVWNRMNPKCHLILREWTFQSEQTDRGKCQVVISSTKSKKPRKELNSAGCRVVVLNGDSGGHSAKPWWAWGREPCGLPGEGSREMACRRKSLEPCLTPTLLINCCITTRLC